MRLWSLHPRYLDRQGLTACWREALLAQAVLLDRTKGYRSHPQLVRFRRQPDPAAAVGAYLVAVAAEATERGYRYDLTKVERPGPVRPIPVTAGQVAHEWQHLTAKLQARSPDRAVLLEGIVSPEVHPVFELVPGDVEEWERATDGRPRE